jgi:protein-S-isoprenylcysteine O-methyltransferase Ste14
MKLNSLMRGLAPTAGDRLEAIRQTKLYDLFTAAPLIAWFLFSALHMLPSVVQQLTLVKLMVQTDPSVLPASLVLSTVSHITSVFFLAVLVIMFAVRQIPRRMPVRLYPRFAAVAGTFIGVGFLWLPPQELSSIVYLASLVLIISGTAFAAYAAFALGRSISVLPEARSLITCGPYAVVRHPLYLGEIVSMAGVALQYLSVWALLLLGLLYVFQFQRMIYEEQVLSRAFPDYGDYMAKTARLVPGIY